MFLGNKKFELVTTEKAIDNGIIEVKSGRLEIAKRKSFGNKIFEVGVSASIYAGLYKPLHLYILSDDEPKVNDWVYDYYPECVVKYEDLKFFPNVIREFNKIIATTNPDLIKCGIDSIDELSVKNFINDYNKNIKVYG